RGGGWALGGVAGCEGPTFPSWGGPGGPPRGGAGRARGATGGGLAPAARARREIETRGFRSLYVRCPEFKLPIAARIAAAMTAFAAGDALGVPWEGSAPDAIDRDRIIEVPQAPWGWPRGTTSDDTAQMLLVARLLTDS